jgi:ferrous iron transport protein A
MSDEKISLTTLATEQSGIIVSYSGGRGMMGRCLSMGIAPGSLIKMVENFNTGPVLVKVHDTNIALGRGLANKIMVTRENGI